MGASDGLGANSQNFTEGSLAPGRDFAEPRAFIGSNPFLVVLEFQSNRLGLFYRSCLGESQDREGSVALSFMKKAGCAGPGSPNTICLECSSKTWRCTAD